MIAAFAAGVWLGRRQGVFLGPSIGKPITEPKPVTDGSASEALTGKVHRLGQKMEEFINDSAHPRELADHAEFRKAVGVFSNPATLLETVVQYAAGANANSACAAFAAFAGHSDRDKPVGTIVLRLVE